MIVLLRSYHNKRISEWRDIDLVVKYNSLVIMPSQRKNNFIVTGPMKWRCRRKLLWWRENSFKRRYAEVELTPGYGAGHVPWYTTPVGLRWSDIVCISWLFYLLFIYCYIVSSFTWNHSHLFLFHWFWHDIIGYRITICFLVSLWLMWPTARYGISLNCPNR